MDKAKLQELMITKSSLDSQVETTMAAIQVWREEMLKVVGHKFFDAQKGFMWESILFEVIRD